MRVLAVGLAILALSYALVMMLALPRALQQGLPWNSLLGYGASALLALVAALLLFRAAYRRK
jgi:hypothetical protein